MLQKINERIQGVIAWIVVILVTVTFTIFGLDYYLQTRHKSSMAKAKVNGKEITKQEFEVNYRRAFQMQEADDKKIIDENNLKKQVLDDMIMNSISVQAALSNGFVINNEQANMAILSIPQFQENGSFSNSLYSRALRGALYTHESFQDEVKRGMLINQQRFAIVGTEFVLSREINSFVKLLMQKRDYNYLLIPSSSFLDKSQVSQDEVVDYYETHKSEYMYPEQVSIDYIKISMKDIKNSITISDDQVKSYYNDNRNNYISPAKWHVNHILLKSNSTNDSTVLATAEDLSKKLQENPNDFTKQADELSKNKNVVTGMLPWIIAGTTDFDRELADFTEINQVSNPIKVENGYEIFKLVDYKPSSTKSFQEVEPIIKEQMILDAAQEKYGSLLEKLADLSYQNPDSLDSIGINLNLPVYKSELFNMSGGNADVTKNKYVIKAAFSHDVLELGNNSDLIQLDNENVVVLRVHKRLPSSQMSLSVVKDEIGNMLLEKKSRIACENFGKKILDENKGLSFEENIKLGINSFGWKKIINNGRDSYSTSSDINDLAFAITEVGDKLGKLLDNGDYVIVSLQKITDGNLSALDKEQIASITQQLDSSYGLMDYNLYINSLMNKAKVIRN